jgi:uncharacterized protein (DUF1015 family)
MVALRPFRALRPRPEMAARVASVPYDVVDRDEAAALAAGNPESFLHVTRPEIDLPPGTDPHAEAVYRAGAAALAGLIERGVLAEDAEPGLFVYRLVREGRAQTGVVGCCAVDDYDAGRIKKHEKTRPDKEDDRTRHALAVGAHVGPVFLTFRGDDPGGGEILRRIAATAAGEPLYDFAAADGVAHTVWRVGDPAGMAAAFGELPAAYVADGHHRAASASRVRAARREAGEPPGGEADVFLAALFPAAELTILAYNRVVRDLGGLDREGFLRRLGERLTVREGGAPEPPARGRVSMVLDGRWYDLEVPPERVPAGDPVASLDAALLQSEVLGPLLGIDDPRTSDRIDFVGGGRGSAELERRVAARPGSVAFALYPLGVGQLLEVADAGRVLPPKSTWFEPKLRSGLLVHRF